MALVALIAAGAIVFLASLPPRAERVDIPPEWRDFASRTVAGAYHVHSIRSDGSGDRAAIAAAAARAGLKFVIITDHGDATRQPDRPAYIDGVLCLDAVEISTDDGHYVALDMPRAPYPLGGAAEAVVEDVGRLGGFGVVAHPDSPKPALRWTAGPLPVDGIEWLNADTEWRDETRLRLARTALAYLVRPREALAELLDRPITLARWDHWSPSRPIVALAAADAHGGIGRRMEDPGAGRGRIRIPSYEAAFRTFSNRVVLDRPLTGDAATDARSVFAAIRAGHVFATIDALASPGLLDLRREGTTIVARALAPAGAQLVMFHAGAEIARTGGSELRWESGGDRGPYRVEVHLPRAPGEPPVPWLVSNQLFTAVAAPKPPPVGFAVPWTGALAPPLAWRVEKDSSSSGTLQTTDAGVTLDYQLGSDRTRSPYVAIVSDMHDQAFGSIEAALTSKQPMRVSVQVRAGENGRWGRSVYVDQSDRLVRVPLKAMRSLDGTAGPPPSTFLTSVLVVIDLTNATPGSAGRLQIRSVQFVQ